MGGKGLGAGAGRTLEQDMKKAWKPEAGFKSDDTERILGCEAQ